MLWVDPATDRRVTTGGVGVFVTFLINCVLSNHAFGHADTYVRTPMSLVLVPAAAVALGLVGGWIKHMAWL